MPSLTLRHLPAWWIARLRSYAAAHDTEPDAAVVHLTTVALDHLEARSAGAAIVNARRTPEERSAIARRAGLAGQAARRAAQK